MLIFFFINALELGDFRKIKYNTVRMFRYDTTRYIYNMYMVTALFKVWFSFV